MWLYFSRGGEVLYIPLKKFVKKIIWKEKDRGSGLEKIIKYVKKSTSPLEEKEYSF